MTSSHTTDPVLQDKFAPTAVAKPGKPALWERGLFALLRFVRIGKLTVELRNGHSREFQGADEGADAKLQIRNRRTSRRILLRGSLGLSESYMDGDWDTPDLTALLKYAAENRDDPRHRLPSLAPARITGRPTHRKRANTRTGSRKNIAYHYDLGNDFYAHWLDPSMTYSSGVYESEQISLADAQVEKYQRMADLLDLSDDHHLLEIGCGWGGFAEFIARHYGCRVTAVTISEAQFDYAKRRIESAGLSDKVDIQLCDYRDLDGRFDRVASIEMIEAVGEENWPVYFGKIRDLLTPGGIAAIQAITIDDQKFYSYRRGIDFIQKYIFPGGMLPSPEILGVETRAAGLAITRSEFYGASYARTLSEWHRRFDAAWSNIETMGFDDRFRRMWKFYLSYCEAGFKIGTVDLAQIRIEHGTPSQSNL